MKNVVITGAGGFISRHLISLLLGSSVNVTAVVRDKKHMRDELWTHSALTVIEGQIEALSVDQFDKKKYDAFFHLAWDGVAPEHKNSFSIQLRNIEMSVTALELCNTLHCDKFIASGTVAEHVFCDGAMDVYARETPNDYYGAAKVAVHHFLEVRARQLNQPFIWLIIPSTYGEGRTDNNILTYTIRTLLKGERPLYGDLNQMWDFLYVKEVARAIRLIGEKGISGKTYGIGSGQYKPLMEFVTMIRDIIDPSLELGIGELPEKTSQTLSSCVDISDLMRDTGFVPNVDFESTIRKTIDYIKETEKLR